MTSKWADRLARLKKWGRISTALAAIVSPWFFILDLQDTLGRQENDIEAVVESHGLKLQELDQVAKEFVPWASNYDQWRESMDEDYDSHAEEARRLRDRVIRLEAYIAATSQGRYEVEGSESNDSEPTTRDHREQLEQRTIRVRPPSAPVVKDVDRARRHKSARERQRCSPKDPSCGADL